MILKMYSVGQLVDSIQLEVKNPTGLAFGGQNYDILYVTTTKTNIDLYTKEESDPEDSPAGQLFIIAGLGATGVPTYRPAA